MCRRAVAHQASCILQVLQPHVLLPNGHHCWVKLPAMHLTLRVEMVNQVSNGASTLHSHTNLARPGQTQPDAVSVCCGNLNGGQSDRGPPQGLLSCSLLLQPSSIDWYEQARNLPELLGCAAGCRDCKLSVANSGCGHMSPGRDSPGPGWPQGPLVSKLAAA